MNAHFFDIDTLIRIENSVWIVSKLKPNEPLVKISQSEFNLIKRGIYRKYQSPLKIGSKTYWIPENLLNQIKIKCKLHKCDITDISFSMQEFMNTDLISNLEHKILFDHFYHLKNTSDDIYVICSKNNRQNYEPIIKKVEDSLYELGLQIKKFYFISETFYNRDEDEISHKKIRLLLQHLLGLKTEGDRFSDEEITKYERVYFYDDEINSINLAHNSNSVLEFLLQNTNKDTKSKIKDSLKSGEHVMVVNQCTNNKVQNFITKNVTISYSTIIKTFESIRFRC